MQIAAGVDALQIFDSHGGHLAAGEFQEASGRWMRRHHLRSFARHQSPRSFVSPSARTATGPISSPPARTSSALTGKPHLAEARKIIPDGIGMQGNLAPALHRRATPEVVAHETRERARSHARPARAHFNLGHGLTPGAKLENIAALVETVKTTMKNSTQPNSK